MHQVHLFDLFTRLVTIIDVTLPDPLSRALCIVCMSDIDYILLFYLSSILFIYFLLLYLFIFHVLP